MPPFPLPDPPLHDDVVRLRPPREDDVAAIAEACQDPLIQRFTFVPVPYGDQDARAFVAQVPAARERGEALSLAITDAATGAWLGSMSLLRPSWEHRVAEIGYFVAPWARGAGRATRAARLLAAWALRDLGLARIEADIDVDNAGSRRVAERAGFRHEGVRRSAIEAKGRRWTLACYSLLPEDLP